MSDLSIRGRLFLVAMLPALLAGVMLYFYFVNSQLELLQNSLLQQGHSSVTHLAISSELGLLTGDNRQLTPQSAALLAQQHMAGVAIANQQGEWPVRLGTLSNTSGLRLLPCQSTQVLTSPEQRSTLSKQKSLLFCAPVLSYAPVVDDYPQQTNAPLQPLRIGSVYVEVNTSLYQTQRQEALAQATRLGLIVFLVTLAIAYRVADQISRPLSDLVNQVSRVTLGDLDQRNAGQERGEIGHLQRGINVMVETLQQDQQQLQARVDARTSDLRAAFQALEQRNIEIEEQRQLALQASQAKSQFLATMSHEIRTPISGLLGMLELMGDTQLDPRQQLYYDNLQLEARALKALIDDILDFSRIEAGKMPIATQPFSPEQLCGEVVAMLAPAAHQKGLEISLFVDPRTPQRVEGDPQRLRQVLINLVSNAIKFTEQGEVYLRLESAETHGIVSVQDTGRGIPMERQGHIFDDFTQADGSITRHHGGTGLGTTIAKRLVELMGGEIGLESQPDQGSRFWFTLPWPIVEPATQTTPSQGQIALLEHNPHTAEATIALLERFGWQTTHYTDALALAGGLEHQQPDWIMLAESGTATQHTSLAERLRQHLGDKQRIAHLIHFTTPASIGAFDQTLYKPLIHAAIEGVFAPPKATPRSTLAPTSSQCSSTRVLIAEDSPINAMVLKNFTEKFGATPILVEDGALALERLRAGGIDLVFMDIRMPKLDGLECTRLWRAEEANGLHIPIIAITANATLEDRDACMQAGMDDFLSKPITTPQVSSILEKWTDSKITLVQPTPAAPL